MTEFVGATRVVALSATALHPYEVLGSMALILAFTPAS